MEFFNDHDDDFGLLDKDSLLTHWQMKLSKDLNAIILKKGVIDIVTDGTTSFYVSTRSSLKRCGG
jgi:NAD(P)H-hydrate repair Nnr-like enzyme with NAD(P)H-hydrate dehydratase domain